MIEITNRQKGPIQLVIKSRVHYGNFTTQNIPGMGAGKNVFLLEDELMTESVAEAEKKGLITTKYVNTVI